MAFTAEDGSRPITSFLLNTTRISAGGPATTQNLVAIDNALYVESVVALQEGGKRVVLVVGGLQQLTYYTFQVAAISSAGEGEFSEPSEPSTLGKSSLHD